MSLIDRSALLPYTAKQMYDLVNDIEAYPQYMEGCEKAKILRHGDHEMEARLVLAKGGIRLGFTTLNRLIDCEEIDLELIEGPFDQFGGCWRFLALGDDACKVSLHLDFRVNSTLLGVAARRLFDTVARNQVQAVARRAEKIYG